MREHILDVAEQVIRGNGLAHATTRRIATKAGCSEGTIYRHFKNKEEVFLAVLVERVPRLLIAMQIVSEKAGKGDVRRGLAQVLRSALEFYDVTIPMTAALFAEPRLLARQQEWMRDSNVGLHPVTQLAQYVAREQAASRFSSEAVPESVASELLGACYLRAYSKQFTDVSPLSDRKFINDTIACLLDGIKVQ